MGLSKKFEVGVLGYTSLCFYWEYINILVISLRLLEKNLKENEKHFDVLINLTWL